jgi:hypothetical protein
MMPVVVLVTICECSSSLCGVIGGAVPGKRWRAAKRAQEKGRLWREGVRHGRRGGRGMINIVNRYP